MAKSSAAFGFAVSPHAIYSVIMINNNMISIMMMMIIIILMVIIIIIRIINNNNKNNNDFVQGIHWMALHLNLYTKVSQ